MQRTVQLYLSIASSSVLSGLKHEAIAYFIYNSKALHFLVFLYMWENFLSLGELQVNVSLSKTTVKDVTLGSSLNVTGIGSRLT